MMNYQLHGMLITISVDNRGHMYKNAPQHTIDQQPMSTKFHIEQLINEQTSSYWKTLNEDIKLIFRYLEAIEKIIQQPQNWLSVSDLAIYIKSSESTIRRLVNRNEIPDNETSVELIKKYCYEPEK